MPEAMHDTGNRPTILLNPGPVTMSNRVRKVFLKEDLCHREPEFAEIVLDIKARLRRVYPEAEAEYEAVLFTGSGTCAVEAIIQSLAPRRGKTLVLSNGVYGERIASMLEVEKKPYVMVKSNWPEPMNLEEAERLLKKDPSITHVAAIHNETTTGRLNDLEKLGALCRRYGKPLLLDTVSSFAGEEVRFKEWNVAALASVSNKCIHGAPGICFVLVRKELMEQGTTEASSLYLDLFKMYKEQKSGYSPFTQATHICVVLQEALREFEEEGGWKARRERYRKLSTRIRREFQALGVELFLPEDAYCSMLTSFKLPPGLTYERLHDALKVAGFVIYAGQAGLYHSIFRIANMGDILDSDIDRLVEAMKQVLGKAG
ncbi:MAG TPA: 2-aminoethylphosphonate--pyruvate transaminase [Spirochaetales bacterium]|nr:2-aminoethylphosphonate--pyruvate transaminase [Spirochaetales bacterium]